MFHVGFTSHPPTSPVSLAPLAPLADTNMASSGMGGAPSWLLEEHHEGRWGEDARGQEAGESGTDGG